MPAEPELLKEIPLFQFLDDAERTELAQQLELIRIPTGEFLFQIDDPGDAMYAIRSGEVEVFVRRNSGERLVLEIARCGDFVGELSLLDGGPRSACVVATEDTEALRLSRDRLSAFLQSHPPAAMRLLAAMGRRLRVSAEHLRRTASRNVNQELEDNRSKVQKAADWIAEFAGSITFLVIHVLVFSLWLGLNSFKLPGFSQFDPYPFGFLTLAVSLEAIFLSVFVLLSQNRQASKDRVRSDVEYEVNLKAELEIVHLHEKMDRLTADVLARLEALQQQVNRNTK